MTTPHRPGLRALVTRPRAEAAELAGLLARRGVESVIEPLMTIAAGGMVVPDLRGIQAILCTSANGVRALALATPERHLRLFAVGDRTAAQARADGFHHVESAGGDVEDLAYLVGRQLRPEDGKLLHVAGSAVAGDLGATLGAAGYTVERATLYEAQAATALTPLTARLIAEGGIDIALFFSPRTAAIFARLVEEAEIAAGLHATTALSISAAADALLAELPFRDRAVAALPTQAALLERIDALLAAAP